MTTYFSFNRQRANRNPIRPLSISIRTRHRQTHFSTKFKNSPQRRWKNYWRGNENLFFVSILAGSPAHAQWVRGKWERGWGTEKSEKIRSWWLMVTIVFYTLQRFLVSFVMRYWKLRLFFFPFFPQKGNENESKRSVLNFHPLYSRTHNRHTARLSLHYTHHFTPCSLLRSCFFFSSTFPDEKPNSVDVEAKMTENVDLTKTL